MAKSVLECLGCKAELLVAEPPPVVGAFLICIECGTECRVDRVDPLRLCLSDADRDDTPGKSGK